MGSKVGTEVWTERRDPETEEKSLLVTSVLSSGYTRSCRSGTREDVSRMKVYSMTPDSEVVLKASLCSVGTLRWVFFAPRVDVTTRHHGLRYLLLSPVSLSLWSGRRHGNRSTHGRVWGGQ